VSYFLCLLLVLAEAPRPPEGMVLIPGGRFQMGSMQGARDEQPVHEVEISSFYLDVHEVTNAQFEAFVKATGYVTEAEQWGWSLVFAPDSDSEERVLGAEWWVKVEGATWRHPEGPASSIAGKDREPVVQVSWNDAVAYCKWAGKRLPTEAEWEYAARGGLTGREYPWGDELPLEGKRKMNIWDGVFPVKNTAEDGYAALAPIGAFPPNAFGLYDMAGNVWEWCADWYAPDYYAQSPPRDPQGPTSGTARVMRGGSWLCSASYCSGYRVAHRNSATPDSGLTNTGFRCAKDVEEERKK
jgi:formylglycine-generating enzyme required for sulfatase activity